MSAYLSPVGNDNFVDSNGDPLTGGKLYTYAAGSSTPAATYTSSTGATPQENPIILNSRGVPASPVWIGGSESIKFIVTDSADVTLQTIDGVTGINDPAVVSSQDEWVALTLTATYLSATSFSVPGDQTLTLQVGRRLKTTNSGGTAYSTISSSSFGSGITTVVVVNDSTTLDSGLSAVSYGILSVTNTSIPRRVSLASSGYERLPSGLIVQWGSAQAAASGSSPVTTNLPLAFPTAAASVIANHAGAETSVNVVVTAKTTTSISLHSNYAPGDVNCYYIAIGY